jgi:CRP/FNR family cyclic AMP-dependent transcriptional regulator
MEWALLAPLAPAERARILDAARRRTFARAEVVVHEGDLAESLHLVATGRLGVRITNRAGESVTLNVLAPGDFFGELALLRTGGPRRRTATIFCLEAAETLSLTNDQFRALCRDHPEVSRLLESALVTRIEDLSRRLLEALVDSLDRRVAGWLVRLSRTYSDGTGATTIPLTQSQLADLTGGTRPSVNQVLSRLTGQQIIEVRRGHILVLDAERLRRKAGLVDA